MAKKKDTTPDESTTAPAEPAAVDHATRLKLAVDQIRARTVLPLRKAREAIAAMKNAQQEPDAAAVALVAAFGEE